MLPTVSSRQAITPTTPFPYQKLRADQFRLLLVSGRRDGRPTCELRTVSLQSDDVPWKALSYRWGDADATEYVFLDDVVLPVRSNLYDFLERTSGNRKSAWYFVDAICINQTDRNERASQVSLMRDIYMRAEEVVVWFSSEKRSLFRRITTRLLPDRTKYSVHTNDYWSRLWIVQEILLAKKLTLERPVGAVDLDVVSRGLLQNCGPGSKPSDDSTYQVWKDMESNLGYSTFDELDDDDRHLKMTFQIICWRHFKGADLRSGKLLSFHEAIALFCTQDCELLHDRTFGLLGIAESRIRPDYGTPVVELFVDTLIDCMLSLGFRKAGGHKKTGSVAIRGDKQIWNTGNSLLLGFGVRDPLLHVSVLLLVLTVCDLFIADGAAAYSVCRIFLFRRLIGDLRLPKPYLQPTDLWNREVHRLQNNLAVEQRDRFGDARVQLDRLKAENAWMASPWPGSGGTQDRRRYDGWARLARGRFEVMWQLWEKDSWAGRS